jgi:hypothetical protein
MKRIEERIEAAFLDLITVTYAARLNQVAYNTEALADDTLSF